MYYISIALGSSVLIEVSWVVPSFSALLLVVVMMVNVKWFIGIIWIFVYIIKLFVLTRLALSVLEQLVDTSCSVGVGAAGCAGFSKSKRFRWSGCLRKVVPSLSLSNTMVLPWSSVLMMVNLSGM